MKRFFIIFLNITVCLLAMAVPAKRVTVKLTNSDGKQIEARLAGDEFFHYYIHTVTGEKLFLNDDGKCYVPTEKEFTHRALQGRKRAATAESRRRERCQKTRQGNNLLDEVAVHSPFDLTGEKHALVILVEFQDCNLMYDHERLDAQMNEEGYCAGGHTGSVHDYFYSQSYGQFDLKIDVVGPVKVSHDMAFYGKNNANGDDMHPATMVTEACRLADEAGTDFSNYDWDGDGNAEMVVCIYAGMGEAQGGGKNTIWPHQWYLSEAMDANDGEGPIKIDGTTIDSYLVLNELAGTKANPHLDGIGTFCHEFSHSLGLPDFYPTSYITGITFGMDAWSLMDYGCYNNNSCTPCGYTAYERWYCGWLTPKVLEEPCEIKDMQPLCNEPEAYIIFNDGWPDEYYVLQNVQQKSWDEYAAGHGMLVLHIDYDMIAWEENSVNNFSEHQRCTIIHADNDAATSTTSRYERSLAGDPYPGTTENHELSNSSRPAAKTFNQNTDGEYYMNKAIKDINEHFDTESKFGTISFNFRDYVPDGISSPLNTGQETYAFDLYGRRISGSPQKGLYVKDGAVRMQ